MKTDSFLSKAYHAKQSLEKTFFHCKTIFFSKKTVEETAADKWNQEVNRRAMYRAGMKESSSEREEMNSDLFSPLCRTPYWPISVMVLLVIKVKKFGERERNS